MYLKFIKTLYESKMVGFVVVTSVFCRRPSSVQREIICRRPQSWCHSSCSVPQLGTTTTASKEGSSAHHDTMSLRTDLLHRLFHYQKLYKISTTRDFPPVLFSAFQHCRNVIFFLQSSWTSLTFNICFKYFNMCSFVFHIFYHVAISEADKKEPEEEVVIFKTT